ncbi:MAG TPA: hypothetical protein VLV54_17005 [Thermoanaerobaculia bacterium]|nr:hypothetical protein [Thermoanaerobaculia bacterium]
MTVIEVSLDPAEEVFPARKTGTPATASTDEKGDAPVAKPLDKILW